MMMMCIAMLLLAVGLAGLANGDCYTAMDGCSVAAALCSSRSRFASDCDDVFDAVLIISRSKLKKTPEKS